MKDEVSQSKGHPEIGVHEVSSFVSPTDLTEQQLVQRYRRGDNAAADVLFAGAYSALQNFIARYAPNLTYEDREDAVQEVLVRASRNGYRYEARAGASFKTFLKQVAKNYLVDQSRKRILTCVPITSDAWDSACDQVSRVSEETLDSGDPTPEEICLAKELAQQRAPVIRKCLVAMPVRDQWVLWMYTDNFTLKQTAIFLQANGFTDRLLTPQGVRSLRESARKKLAVLFAASDIEVTP